MKKLFVMMLVMVLAINAFALTDTYSGSRSLVALYADSSRADVTGPTIDLGGTYPSTSCLFSINVGACFATLASDLYALIILQESANGSSWTDVTSSKSILGTHAVADSGALVKLDAAAEDSTIYRFGYIGNKRYVRLLIDWVGSVDDIAIIGAEAIVTRRFSGARP